MQLNTDDLTIHTYEPQRGQSSGSYDPSAATSDPALTPATGSVTVDAERRFGRRLQVGFQFNF